jgi:hypothetical protein
MNDQTAIHRFAATHSLPVGRDKDGTYIICGKAGHVFEQGGSLLGMQAAFRSTRQCKSACRRLQDAGCTVIQRGDTEICATFDPSDDVQAQLALRIARIPRKRRVSPASLAALARHRHIGQFRRAVDSPAPKRGAAAESTASATEEG